MHEHGVGAAVDDDEHAVVRIGDERGHQRVHARGRPVLVRHPVPVGAEPLHVGDRALGMLERPGEPAIITQRRMCLAQRDQRAREPDERTVGVHPVDPGRLVVLRVRIVVATLRVSEFVAHAEHRRAARTEQRRQQGARIALAPRPDVWIVARSFEAVIPRGVRVGAVPVPLPIGVILLALVRDEVGEREAVVRRHEVHRARRRALVRAEDVGGPRQACREFADRLAVPAPEATDRVAIAIVPLSPVGREVAELVAAVSDVPRLGDVLERGEYGIAFDRAQERRLGVEPLLTAPQRRGQIIPEPVDSGPLRVVAKCVERETRDRGAVERERVSRAGVVHVARRVAAHETIVGRVVETAQRERGSILVALTAVIQHHIEQDFDSGLVECLDAGAQFTDAPRREPRVRHHPADRVVAPIVRETGAREMALADRGGDGEELNGRDAELHEVVERGRVRESGAGAAQWRRHAGMPHGETAHVHLVDDALTPARAGALRARASGAGTLGARAFVLRFPVGQSLGDDRLRHHAGAVGAVGTAVGTLSLLRRVQPEAAVECARVRIHEQLGRVESMPLGRREGSVRPQAVPRADLEPGDESVEDGAGTLRQHQPFDLEVPRCIEETEFDRRRIRRVHRDVRASTEQRHPERLGVPGEEAARAHCARCSTSVR